MNTDCKYRQDRQPVKRGKWKDGEKSQVCTICGGWGLDSFAYCPHCGARMDGETNGGQRAKVH